MRSFYSPALVISVFSLCLLYLLPGPSSRINLSKPLPAGNKLYEPGDHFFIQRSWPDTAPDYRAFVSAINAVKNKINERSMVLPGFDAAWTTEGPGNIGGRINVVISNPVNPDILFAGCATGGIFKSIDNGLTWFPVFDDQPFLSIGCLAFEPGNPDVIYAGTGDPNISGYPFIGDGICKSSDGGTTWTNIGLTDQRIISKIIIDPTNVNTIYASTMGIPFERNTDRGLYKSTDGGLSWTQVLFISDDSGVIDMVLDYNNPQTIYAAGWNRIRNNQESLIVGQAAKIYKTTDGGLSWTILANGLPQNDMSRIGLTMSKTNSQVIYAVYVNDGLDFDGVYKTSDGGANWNLQAGNGIDPGFMGGFGWYFGRIEVNPFDDNEIFICGVDLYKSNDGGNNWIQSDANYETHADKHDVHYLNANTILLATDGGLYKSVNGGTDWQDTEFIPNTQFYRVTSNPFNSGEYAGGTQDNGTVSGNASSLNNWQRIFGGDGFTIAYDPVDPLIFYVETQNGEIWATSDGGTFIDYISGTIDASDRRNWDMQYIISSHNPSKLYTGTYRIYQNNSGPVDAWFPISPDLTDGVVFQDRFHTISTVNESPLIEGNIFAGTSDGNVWRSLNGGNVWQNITGTLPDRYVTSIKASSNNSQNLYLTLSGYKYNDFTPHVFKSFDNGTTWNSISGNLPQIAVNDILVYPGNDSVYFIATDGGVYATVDGGQFWERVGNNMPVFPVYDIEYELATNKLIAGTHARSVMTYPIDSILLATGLSNDLLELDFSLYPNPASDILYINSDFKTINGKPVVVKIYNLSSELVFSEKLDEVSLYKINIKHLSAGSYIISLSDDQKSAVKKFMKL